MEVTPAIRTRYRAYLQSDDWRTRRNRALKLASFRCQTCGSKRGLEVHHNTYERLGREWDQDLDILCCDCHEGHHASEMHDSSQGRLYLGIVTDVLTRETFESIADLSAAVMAECVRLKMPYAAHDAERAIGLLSGRTKFSEARAPAPANRGAWASPPNRAEARELLKALSARLGRSSVDDIRTIVATISTIDIYGPIPREKVEYDRY